MAGSLSMRRVEKWFSVIPHSSNAQPRLSPNTKVFSDMGTKTGKYVLSLTRLSYKRRLKFRKIIQTNHRFACGLVMCPGSKLHEVDFDISNFNMFRLTPHNIL